MLTDRTSTKPPGFTPKSRRLRATVTHIAGLAILAVSPGPVSYTHLTLPTKA